MDQDELRDGVRAVRDGSVLRIILSSPASRNAQTPAMWKRLAEIGSSIPDDVSIVVLTGEGLSFSAGLDRRMLTPEGVPGEPSLFDVAAMSPEGIDAFIREAQAAFRWWRDVPQVTIACVHGYAIGAGFQLALACDLLIAADDAQFAMRETSLGLVPDLCGTAPLVERVGYSRALEICATGRLVSADEAVSLGIATHRAPQAEWSACVDDLVSTIGSAPRGAVTSLKGLLRGAATAADQPARERDAQVARLRDLVSGAGT